MSRGSVRCLYLLVCVCFTLSMLFSDTLKVNAYNPVIQNYLVQNHNVNISGNYAISMSGGAGSTTNASISGSFTNGNGSVYGGSGSTISFVGGSGEFRIPIFLSSNTVNYDIVNTNYYVVAVNNNSRLSVNLNFDNDQASISNLRIEDVDGNIIFKSGVDFTGFSNFYRGSYINVLNQNTYKMFMPVYVCGEYSCSKIVAGTMSYFDGSGTLDLTGNLYFDVFGITDSAQQSLSTQVSDIVTQEKLDSLNDSTDKIEESVTSDTGGGILATIKNFFGSFFQNVFNTLVSVFVPEDGFFSDWFNRLNTLLSEKLGMLYAPFDLLITTLTAIMNADTTDTGIPFPGIQWEDTYLVEPFTFYFSSLGDTFTDLQGYVYFATDTVLLFAFLYLLQNKIRLILEGHESG